MPDHSTYPNTDPNAADIAGSGVKSEHTRAGKTYSLKFCVGLLAALSLATIFGLAFRVHEVSHQLAAVRQSAQVMSQDQRTQAAVNAVYNEQLAENAASIANHQPAASTSTLQAYFRRNYPGFNIQLTVWRGKHFGGEVISVDGTSPTGHVFRMEGGGAAIYGFTRACTGAGQPGGCYRVRRPPYGSYAPTDFSGAW